MARPRARACVTTQNFLLVPDERAEALSDISERIHLRSDACYIINTITHMVTWLPGLPALPDLHATPKPNKSAHAHFYPTDTRNDPQHLQTQADELKPR